jgi:predicted  nucleic acid-binding Zn-ribbon protein
MSVVQRLYQLQIVDSEWDETSRQLAEVEASLGETDDLVRAREAVAEIQKSLEGLRQESRELDLEIAGVSAKLKANQDRLYSGKVRNPKELSGLHEEAGALRRRCSELEDGQLELLMAAEEAEAELAERQARLRQIEGTWHEDQAALQAQKEELALRLLELEEDRAQLRAPLAAAELADYDDLRWRLGGTAVARFKRGACQACGVDLPTGVALAVERGEGVHYCPICRRLLYGG